MDPLSRGDKLDAKIIRNKLEILALLSLKHGTLLRIFEVLMPLDPSIGLSFKFNNELYHS